MEATLILDPKNPTLWEKGLEGLVAVDKEIMRGGKFGALYHSGIVYRPELREDWLPVTNVYAQGHGDCEDLMGIRIAELHLTGEDLGARPHVFRTGQTRWHATIKRSDGSIEDPTKILKEIEKRNRGPRFRKRPQGETIMTDENNEEIGQWADPSAMWQQGAHDPYADVWAQAFGQAQASYDPYQGYTDPQYAYPPGYAYPSGAPQYGAYPGYDYQDPYQQAYAQPFDPYTAQYPYGAPTDPYQAQYEQDMYAQQAAEQERQEQQERQERRRERQKTRRETRRARLTERRQAAQTRRETRRARMVERRQAAQTRREARRVRLQERREAQRARRLERQATAQAQRVARREARQTRRAERRGSSIISLFGYEGDEFYPDEYDTYEGENTAPFFLTT